MDIMKITLILIIVALVGTFFVFDGGQYLTLSYIKSQQLAFAEHYQASPMLFILSYVVIYIVVTGLSLPGAAILTLLGGGLFGTLTGVIVVSFASTIGATIAFLVSRYILHDIIQNRYSKQLHTFNKGMAEEGAFYLFGLRLIPVVPFFIINLVMGLTNIKTLKFFWVSQLGMLAGTVVYVYAGTQLSTIENLSDIIKPQILIAFTLLGTLPLITKKIVRYMKEKRRG